MKIYFKKNHWQNEPGGKVKVFTYGKAYDLTTISTKMLPTQYWVVNDLGKVVTSISRSKFFTEQEWKKINRHKILSNLGI